MLCKAARQSWVHSALTHCPEREEFSQRGFGPLVCSPRGHLIFLLLFDTTWLHFQHHLNHEEMVPAQFFNHLTEQAAVHVRIQRGNAGGENAES
jgi:hypothetical protein